MIHNSMRKHMIIIFGPTCVGKSDFAERIASKTPSEIVNMDLGQFYTPLSIGTAKPDWRKSMSTHHLFDVLCEPHDFTVAAYRDQLLHTLEQIWQRGNMPILVGGSSFYLQSIFFPPGVPTHVLAESTSVSKTFAQVLEAHEQDSWDLLHTIDPERAKAIDKNDTYRIARALAIWRSTGKKPSEFTMVYDPPASFDLFFLTRDRQQLYDRINKRVLAMMEGGWLQEVRGLKGTSWETFLVKKKLIGYDDLCAYLDGQQTPQALQRVIATIARRTRNYAKRQETFWKMLEKKMVSQQKERTEKGIEEHFGLIKNLDLTNLDLDLFCNQLVERLPRVVKQR